MAYTFDYRDGDVLAWSLTDDGATAERTDDYTPTVYVSAATRELLAEARGHLRGFPTVRRTALERKRVGFRHDPEAVLRVDVASIDAVRDVAGTVAGWRTPGTYRLYDVDVTREFRFWLDEATDEMPLPSRELRTVEIDAPTEQLGRGEVRQVTVDGVAVEGATAVVETVRERLDVVDPDVLVLASSRLVPLLYDLAERAGRESFDLGRRSGYEQLAGASTYESYGRVGHSPARYNVPGRAIVDRSNSFVWNQTNLEGCLYLIERSGLPLQELAWSSIGRILTAIQIREARRRDVLVPWHSWRHEFFKPMPTLRQADRGGFTFAPDVGLHEDVHELDFSSLYPNVIATRNVSPERIRCECHADREDVPGLGYSICDEEGYLPGLLQELIDDRDEFKERLERVEDPERRRELEGRSDAIKWILVSCFGYQGFSNAKFGRIECHEAINAFAREILLDAKETLEAGGWRVVHGIVDSLWVVPIEDAEQEPLDNLRETITDDAEIRLEYEAAYDWIAFVPRRTDDAGALTKYFGRRRDDGEYTYRGIECRQRSTPAYVADVQRELIAVLDDRRDPERVCDALAGRLDDLRRGDVDPADLVETVRVSKSLEEYDSDLRTVAALTRADAQGIERRPGQAVSYVVVDDGAGPMERVRLPHESPDTYDVDYYAESLRRAAESVLSPLGWRQDDVERYLTDRTDASLAQFGEPTDYSRS